MLNLNNDNDLDDVFDYLYGINNLNNDLTSTNYYIPYSNGILAPAIEYSSSNWWVRFFDADNELVDRLEGIKVKLIDDINK